MTNFNQQWEDFAKYIADNSIARGKYKVRASKKGEYKNGTESVYNTVYEFLRDNKVLATNKVDGVTISRGDEDNIDDVLTSNLRYIQKLLGKYPNIIMEEPKGLELEIRNAIRGLGLLPLRRVD